MTTRKIIEKVNPEIESRSIEYAEEEPLQPIKSFRASEIYQQFHSAKEWKVRDEDWVALEKVMDAAYPYFFEWLKSIHFNMSDIEYKVCCLVKIQVSKQNIARIINLSKQSVTMIRKRLYEKIHGSPASAKDFDDFINSL